MENAVVSKEQENSLASGVETKRPAVQRPLLKVPFDAERWREHGYKLGRVSQAMYWRIGDWLIAGEPHLGPQGTYKEAAAITGHSFESLYNLAWIVKKFPTSLRKEEALSWSHHKELATPSISDQERAEFLDRAVQEKWTVATLREQLGFHRARQWFETPEGKEAAKAVKARDEEARASAEKAKQAKKEKGSQEEQSGEPKYRYIRVPFTRPNFRFIKKLAIARRTSPEALLFDIIHKFLESDLEAIRAEIKNAKPEVMVLPNGHEVHIPPRAWRPPTRRQTAA